MNDSKHLDGGTPQHAKDSLSILVVGAERDMLPWLAAGRTNLETGRRIGRSERAVPQRHLLIA